MTITDTQKIEKIQELLEKYRDQPADARSSVAFFKEIEAATADPSMATVVWDPEEHFLAEADTEAHGKVIMLTKTLVGIACYVKESESKTLTLPPAQLKPTGHKATLILPDEGKLFKDADGDIWECIDGKWTFGHSHGHRKDKIERGYGHHTLPDYCGPYTEVSE